MFATYFLRPITLRALIFMMGAISPRAYATEAGYCPKVIIQMAGIPRCTEGEMGCMDDTQGAAALATVKQGCADGRAGEGSPCLYGLYIMPDGKAKAICGPRLLDAKK